MPVSTSSTTATRNEIPTLVDEIKKHDTGALISFLQEWDLGLDLYDKNIIRNVKITGRDFLDITKQDFQEYGIKGGPAIRLVKFAKECKEKKLKVFSIYRSLKEVLEKYDLASKGTEIIPIFTPQIHKIPEDNKHLEQYMADILWLKSYGTLVLTSLEFMCNEYVSTILHTTLRIAEDAMKKKFNMKPEYEIIGDEGCRWVDYTVKASKAPFSIEFTEDALVKNSEKYQTLCKGVKKVLGTIIGLLEDRACMKDKSERKRARIEKYYLKK
ncbi:hypothetical protein F8M41_014464 [Gigaspora margarita]|uniref:SAM domain-containing protein n=1 Tax=Gigaspora margarita TaxID=4874 RepID=A0A8H3WYM8_GIGMA|nr:hypothetical protein F8M41_014464 [Gigaspora margarita]